MQFRLCGNLAESVGAAKLPPVSRERWLGILGSAAIACALAVLASFLGEVRAPAGLLLLLIVLAAVAGAFRISRLVLQVGAGLLAAALALALLTPILRAPLQALTLAQSPVKADAIVVLGGGVQCGSRTLESSSLTRLIGGLKLWRAGYAPMLTVSEQSGLIGSPNCPKMSVLEREYIRALYPQGGPEVLTLRNVTTTRDEAARVKEYATQRGWKQILLVTSPSHSRRAQALFQSYGIQAVSVPAAEIRYDEGLPLPSDRLVAVRLLTYEWLSRLKAAIGGTPER